MHVSAFSFARGSGALSLGRLVLADRGLRGNDALVARFERLRLGEGVHRHRDVLAAVDGGPVTDNDRGGVLVGHDNGRLRESVPEGVRVIQGKGLLHHAAVEGVALLELLSGEGDVLGELVGVRVDGLGGADVEAHGDGLAVLEEDSAAGSDARVLKHGSGLLDLRVVLLNIFGEPVSQHFLDVGLQGSLLLELLFADGHLKL